MTACSSSAAPVSLMMIVTKIRGWPRLMGRNHGNLTDASTKQMHGTRALVLSEGEVKRDAGIAEALHEIGSTHHIMADFATAIPYLKVRPNQTNSKSGLTHTAMDVKARKNPHLTRVASFLF